MSDLNLDMMTFTELKIMKENKNSFITELTVWINTHRPEHVLWAQKTADRIELIMEEQAIEAELIKRRIQLFN